MRRPLGLFLAGGIVLAGAALAVIGIDLEVATPDRGEDEADPGNEPDRDEPEAHVPAPESRQVAAEWLPDGTPVFVSRRNEEVAVVDARSPHLLEAGLEVYVAFCAGRTVAWEPFYGSMFSWDGRWVGGPAPAGLATYEATLEGDVVRVGERRDAPPREELDGVATASGPGGCSWMLSHPDTVHHHVDAEPISPEELVGSDRSEAAVVLGAVERVDAETRRACSWEPISEETGPLCDDDAPEVEPSPFGFLSEGWGSTMYGSYGLYLMTSHDGRLQVQGVLPEQAEYSAEHSQVPPAEIPGAEGSQER